MLFHLTNRIAGRLLDVFLLHKEEQNMDLKEETMPVYRSYKDRVFRRLLQDKKRLLEVYNALNDTSYKDEEQLQITTLDNAIYIKMKNDVSFIIDSNMCLYEHQSSYCPNMPLRGFLYFADLYKKHIRDVELSVRKLIKIPTPHYIVFYNGTEREEEEFQQLLSEAFEDNSEGCIELKVRIININYGRNKELMEKSKTLSDYAYFVSCIRKYMEEMPLETAVTTAVEECIEKGILQEFLCEQKAEVIAMSIYEYNEEYARKAFFEEGREDGYDKGVVDGKREGRKEGRTEGRTETLVNSIHKIMEQLNLEVDKACELLGISVEEYELMQKYIHEGVKQSND